MRGALLHTMGATFLWVCLVTIGAPSAADAQAVYSHPVQDGDTLASIAQRYYADPTREAILREANHLRGAEAKTLVPGSWIFIPTVTYYRVQDGDTWNSIGMKLYGDAARGQALVAANKANRRKQPDPGEELVVPYPLLHVVGANETVPKIAKLYLGGGQVAARRIRRFNPEVRIERGVTILVPVYDLKLSDEGRAATTEAFSRAAGGGEDKTRQQMVNERIPKLIRNVREGAYAEAVAVGNRLLGMGKLSSSQVVTIRKELAVAYVALDREDLAVRAFSAALKLQPNLELDTVRTSPRVLAAFNQAKDKAKR